MERPLFEMPDLEEDCPESLSLWFCSLPSEWQETLIDALRNDKHRRLLSLYYFDGVSLEDLAVRLGCDTAYVELMIRRFHLLAAETLCDYMDQRVFK